MNIEDDHDDLQLTSKKDSTPPIEADRPVEPEGFIPDGTGGRFIAVGGGRVIRHHEKN